MARYATYEEVRAGDLQVGDLATRARSRAFYEITAREIKGARVELTLSGAGVSRPLCSSIWWRQTSVTDSDDD